MTAFASALAGVASATLAGVLSLGASPAAYDSAAAHQGYQITVYSTSKYPMTIHPQIAREYSENGGCGIQWGKPVSWASIDAPSSFNLAPFAKRTFIVSVGTPPPGDSELVAAFIATTPLKGTGAQTSAGVGTALRFHEAGATPAAPCPKASPVQNKNPHYRGTFGVAKAASTAPLEIAVGVLAALLAGAIVGFLIITRRRRQS